MPYIPAEKRKRYDPLINNLVEALLAEDEQAMLGDLNYFIYATMLRYLSKRTFRYHRIAALLGTLECCKQEFYRRVAGPYEDKAIERSGDIAVDEKGKGND